MENVSAKAEEHGANNFRCRHLGNIRADNWSLTLQHLRIFSHKIECADIRPVFIDQWKRYRNIYIYNVYV